MIAAPVQVSHYLSARMTVVFVRARDWDFVSQQSSSAMLTTQQEGGGNFLESMTFLCTIVSAKLLWTSVSESDIVECDSV